jgi:hypothetical protein
MYDNFLPIGVPRSPAAASSMNEVGEELPSDAQAALDAVAAQKAMSVVKKPKAKKATAGVGEGKVAVPKEKKAPAKRAKKPDPNDTPLHVNYDDDNNIIYPILVNDQFMVFIACSASSILMVLMSHLDLCVLTGMMIRLIH